MMVFKVGSMSPYQTTQLNSAIYSTILFLSLSAGVWTFDYISADVIYKDLEILTTSCQSRHRCRDRNPDNVAYDTLCDCDQKCAVLGTCCADSEYRTRKGRGFGANCVDTNDPKEDKLVLMIEKCFSKRYGAQELCLGDAEDLDDPLLLIPVTSPATGITYKNYFCFACNENFNQISPVFWNITIISKDTPWCEMPSDSPSTEGVLQDLHFHPNKSSWIIRNTGERVELSVHIPQIMKHHKRFCPQPFIETCAEHWTDVDTKVKCESYMAIVWRPDDRVGYRNPHCAMCNFVNLFKLVCYFEIDKSEVIPFLIGYFYLQLENRCLRNMMFDPISKKCRVVKCGRNQIWYYGECRNSSSALISLRGL